MIGAFRELIRHPIRSFLICQGILWAVTLMVAPAAILEGSREAAVGRSEELGTDRIQLEIQDGAPRPLDEADLAALKSRFEDSNNSGVPSARVTGISALNARFSGNRSASGWILQTDNEEPFVRSLELAAGRWLSSGAVPPELVIESSLAKIWLEEGESVEDLTGREAWIAPGSFGSQRVGFGTEAPEGATRYKIVGVMAPVAEIDPLGFGKDHSFTELIEGVLKMLGVAPDSAPWLEAGTSVHVSREDFPVTGKVVDWVVIKTDPSQVQEVGRLAEEELLRRGCATLIYSNAAWAVISSPELDGYLVLHDVFFVISAVTGFLVLANLLLLTGRRRRGEVGLRRAEGATRFDIFRQFLWEGLVIALFGAVLGTLMAMGLAEIRVWLDPSALLAVTWPWGTIFESVLIVSIGAALASAGPAWSVSGVDPAGLLSEKR
ncbi:MAG: hypothetical protein CBC13_11390 [Planctomycetia bacterium TMED53]|nr:MAG: hypothetical protein CBC13_11390 [Planctomycetia bacterium TMED53]